MNNIARTSSAQIGEPPALRGNPDTNPQRIVPERATIYEQAVLHEDDNLAWKREYRRKAVKAQKDIVRPALLPQAPLCSEPRPQGVSYESDRHIARRQTSNVRSFVELRP